MSDAPDPVGPEPVGPEPVGAEPVDLVRAADLVDGDPTPGMRRQVAFESASLWAGLVHTEPGAASGWHHHGEHDTSLYVVAGSMRLEFGAGGASAVEAGPGEFLRVPPHTVHRESNPGAARSTAVIGRARGGDGPPTVNVDGPDAAGPEAAGPEVAGT